MLDPVIDVAVGCETLMLRRSLSYAYQARMRISMVPVPKSFLLVPERIHNQLYPGRGVGNKYHVEFLRIGVEQLQEA
jgi:hypothetical protein